MTEEEASGTLSSAHEPWYVWRWDRMDAPGVELPMDITRWRRGSFLTVYRFRTSSGGVQWWFYGPFNLAIGFGKG